MSAESQPEIAFPSLSGTYVGDAHGSLTASVAQRLEQLAEKLDGELQTELGSTELAKAWLAGSRGRVDSGCTDFGSVESPQNPLLDLARDSQTLAEALLQHATEAIFLLNDAICLYCNPRVTEQLGYPVQEIVGQWPIPFGDWNDRVSGFPPSLADLHRSALQGESHQLEYILKRYDGQDFSCDLQVFGLDWAGRRHVVVIAKDNQNRTRFEAELRRHTDFLDNIINAVPDPIFVTDARQKLVLANEAYCREFLTNQGLVQKTCAQNEEVVQTMDSPVDSDLASFGADELEHQQTTATGDVTIHSVRRSVFRDQMADSSYVVAVSRDITAERRRQERLGLLASVFSNAVEGVAILDERGNILEANPKLLELLGLDESCLEERSLTELLDIRAIESVHSWQDLFAESSWTGKVTYQHPDGGRHWFRLSLSKTCTSRDSEEGTLTCQVIALFADITQLEESQKRLEFQSRHDALTGLANRQWFTDALAGQLEQCWGSQRELAVIRLGLDDFKGINDNFGYEAGDLILSQVAARLQAALDVPGLIARIGGDEFAVMVTDSGLPSGAADQIAQRFLSLSQRPYRVGEAEAIVNTSIGIATFPTDGMSAAALMSNADVAMYQAKASGKNQFMRFSSAMQSRVARRHALHVALREVIQTDGLSMYYQPKIDARTGLPAGCEALMRWIRDDGSMVSPAEFIPIAEQTGLILSLGDLALERVMQTASQWAVTQPDLLPIAVNVSLQQFRKSDFLDVLLAKCARYRVRPEWVDLEITESVMADDVSAIIVILRRLAEHGFKIALDDFGTAYSSLSYLRHFSLKTLKVDRSFVTDLGTDPNLLPIVKTIISLARGLNLLVVAEGVETPEQQQLLVDAGCDYLQGYLIGRPMPQSELEKWSRQRQQN